MIAQKNLLYWTYSKEKIFAEMNTSAHGLSQEEAKKRIGLYGENTIPKNHQKSLLLKFFSKFLNPLVLILIFASFISAFLGQITNFVIVVAIIVVSVVIDFYQEYHAEKASEKLQQKVSLTATVIRGDEKRELPASEITVGDLIHLAAGDIVPADAYLLTANDLVANQSLLTGEAYPQDKNVQIIEKGAAAITDKLNCVFMGTNIVSGEATAIVVNISGQTELGKIAHLLSKEKPETDFEQGVKHFGVLLMKTTLILVIFVFFVNAFIKKDILESFLFALALAVGLTPELLPMILTINLSRGATRMSKKEVIVKDLPAIQNFGSMDVLCTDKTGTLTEDHIQLERYEDIDEKDSKHVLLYGFLNSYFQAGLKSPLEKAVIAHSEVNIHDYKKVDEVPFDFVRKRLSVVVSGKGHNFLITKGAPENTIHLTTHYFKDGKNLLLTKEIRERIEKRFAQLSASGYRVLLLASREIEKRKNYTEKDEKELSFLGLMVFLDPPKQSAKEALKILNTLGVEIKILTGDNELVTKKICEELNLPIKGVVVGSELEKHSEEALFNLIKNATIFARLNPSQKQRVILSLKRHKYVVGYLGDGINDSPSLKTADIGISVNNAVDVAKESADLILMRKDLHVLIDGVKEGRRTHGNIMKYIMMGTSSNFGNMFSVAIASLFLPFLPMLPIQILLNNLLYDFSQLAVPSDDVDPEYLDKPKKWDIKTIKHFMLVFGPISSMFDLITFLILIFILHATVPLFQTGWFVESLVTQSLIIFSIRTIRVPFLKSKPSLLLVVGSVVIAVIGLILPFTPIASIFEFTRVPAVFYMFLGVLMIFYFLTVEQVKTWFYRKYPI